MAVAHPPSLASFVVVSLVKPTTSSSGYSGNDKAGPILVSLPSHLLPACCCYLFWTSGPTMVQPKAGLVTKAASLTQISHHISICVPPLTHTHAQPVI